MNEPRLIVVDDEPDVCDFIREVAEESGFDVAVAGNQEEFSASRRSFAPSLIILDLHMPGGDGIQILRQLAEEKSEAQILLVSGLDSRVRNAALRLGKTHGLNMLGTLQKPIALSDLKDIFQRTKPAERSITETDLRDAIAAEQLLVHYQPKINVRSDRSWETDSLEALVRWSHPQYGLIFPDEFLPLAERNRLFFSLTDYVLRAALQQVRAWEKEGFTLSVAVNLAPRLLDDLELPDRYSDIVNEFGIKTSRVIFEITETEAMADVTRSMDILTRFRLKGFELSIDDFGTGYSSLIQLYRMPFSEIKIDKSFVMEVDENEEASVIVRAINDLAHNLGLTVCAEGVETQEALDLLRSVGCEKAQGYYMSRPVPADEISSLLTDWKQG